MATNDQDTAGGGLFFRVALLAVSVTAAVGFGRVFDGGGATLRLVLVASASILLAILVERWHVLLSLLVTILGLGVAIGLSVFPSTTWWGIPTLDTVRAAQDALALVGRTAQVQVAPAIPLPPLLIAAVTAAWSAAFASHALAVRARSPFLALLPPASLLAFANIVVDDGVRPAYVVVFLVAALAVLFADAVRRVGHWGPVTMWRTGFEPDRDGLGARVHSAWHVPGSTTGRSARRLGTAAVVAALAGAWILPGFRSPGILSLNNNANPLHVSIDPIVDIKPALLNNRPVRMFTVRSTRASYWRFLSLDRFDGERWTSSNLQAKGGPALASGPLISAGEIDQAITGPDSSYLEQEFHIDKLSQPWLPAAYNPIGVAVRGGVVRYDPVANVLFAPNGTFPGFSYTVNSIQLVPPPSALDADPPAPASEIGPYIELPADTPRQIYRIAHHLTDKETTVYRKVLAVQDYLRDNFRYDLSVTAGHDTNHILRFLTKTKAGYCEQFAGSMAVLLRALGIPSRVAVGFTAGRLIDPAHDLWDVTLQNAHAWVEVFFAGYGWLAFEPTPTRSNPAAITYTDPAGGTFGGVAGVGVGRSQQPNEQGGGSGRPRVGSEIAEGLPAASSPDTAPGSETAPAWRRWAVPAAVVLLVLLGLGIPAAKAVRRRLRLSRARDPRDRVLVAFELLSLSATDLGLGRRAHETLEEYRGRLKAEVSSLDGDLDRLTTLTTVAAYSGDSLTSQDAAVAVASGKRAAGDMRKAAGPVRRVVGWFRPGTFRPGG
jgi:transglutaminase-like putative cysteine protease